MPIAVSVDIARERIAKSFVNSVVALFWDDTHWDDSTLLISVPPIVAVLASSGCGRSSRALFHNWDDLSSSLGDLGDELSVEVSIIIDDFSQWLSSNSCMESVWVLGSAVVSPDNNVLNIFDFAANFSWNLRESSALIKSGHGSEVFLWDWRSISRGDQSVGVCWVSDNTNLHGLLSDLIEGGALSLENLCIGLKKISSLHSWSSWSSTNKDDDISILESN